MKITAAEAARAEEPAGRALCVLTRLGAPAFRHAGGTAHRRAPGRLGRGFAQGLAPPEIAAAAIEHALKSLLLGENPLDTEVLWHRMYHHTRDYGRKGSVIPAISAVGTALRDIAGKAHGLPSTSCSAAPSASGCSPMPPASR
jgi:L-alanine-DL-glutamate epimerase-like enolase superfamily enzyme